MTTSPNKDLRISLQFSKKKEEAVAVAHLLKGMGRKKSEFITKAILFYQEQKGEEKKSLKKESSDKKAAPKEILKKEEVFIEEKVSEKADFLEPERAFEKGDPVSEETSSVEKSEDSLDGVLDEFIPQNLGKEAVSKNEENKKEGNSPSKKKHHTEKKNSEPPTKKKSPEEVLFEKTEEKRKEPVKETSSSEEPLSENFLSGLAVFTNASKPSDSEY